MRRRPLLAPLLLVLAACGEAGGADDGGIDGGPAEVVCDEATGRAVLAGDFECPDEPEYVTIQARYRFDVFKYEASHPLATEAQAFPCATSKGRAFEAPRQVTPACSRPGVRPWHSVRWEEADRACKAVGEGWRLCKGDELQRACAGPDGFAYTFGPAFTNGACNLRESWAPGGEASEAPTGALAGCVSAEGAYDLTGNLWEWTDERENSDPGARFNQGAGWRTVPQRHTTDWLTCDTRSRLPSISARSYANPDVGFRCCRTAQ